MPTPTNQKIEAMVELTAKHFMASKTFSRRAMELGDGLGVSSWVREGTEDVALMLHTYIWSQPCKTIEVRWPMTWWDHFKMTYKARFPKWLWSRLRPIELQKVTLSSWEGYPDVRIMKDFHKPVRFVIKEEGVE